MDPLNPSKKDLKEYYTLLLGSKQTTKTLSTDPRLRTYALTNLKPLNFLYEIKLLGIYQEVNVKVVPSGPLTVDVPPSPLLVRPPWLRSRSPYLA